MPSSNNTTPNPAANWTCAEAAQAGYFYVEAVEKPRATTPHFTTIASFIAGLGDEVAQLFARVLVICDRQGLIGRELVAIGGVKLPASAANAKSGTRADFVREADKMEAAFSRKPVLV